MTDTVSEPVLVYIAGPMSGYPDLNYPVFNRAEEFLLERGYVALNPVRADDANPTPGTPQKWDWYMRRTVAMVLQSHGIAVLDDWQCSIGASLEVQIAHTLRIPVKPLYTWPHLLTHG